jgi:hypothetical protein
MQSTVQDDPLQTSCCPRFAPLHEGGTTQALQIALPSNWYSMPVPVSWNHDTQRSHLPRQNAPPLPPLPEMRNNRKVKLGVCDGGQDGRDHNPKDQHLAHWRRLETCEVHRRRGAIKTRASFPWTRNLSARRIRRPMAKTETEGSYAGRDRQAAKGITIVEECARCCASMTWSVQGCNCGA